MLNADQILNDCSSPNIENIIFYYYVRGIIKSRCVGKSIRFVSNYYDNLLHFIVFLYTLKKIMVSFYFNEIIFSYAELFVSNKIRLAIDILCI